MNKTVSKNPVLRFKLGRKIQKAQFGDILNYVTRYTSPLGSVAAAYDIYNAIPENTVTKYLKDFYYGYDRNAYLLRQKSKKGTHMPRTRVKKAMVITNTDGSKYLINTDGTRNLLSKPSSTNQRHSSGIATITPNSNNSRSVTPHYYTSKYKNRMTQLGLNSINDVIAFLKRLGVKADGIWGDNTEAAWLKKESPGAKFLAGVTSTPEIDEEILNTPETIPSILNTPIQLNNITTSNPFGINGINFNMAQTDDIMKRVGIIPKHRFAKKGGTLIKNKKN